MNEINFEYVKYYINQGKLKNWKYFIDKYGLFIATSEEKYEELEPWIQWPTVRTGMTYKEHNIFRLGDIKKSKIKQHWEILESHGYSVAAISPINASNNTKKSPFWIPDPWVDTKISGKGFILRIAKAIKQAVNDNSQAKLEHSTIISIIEAMLTKTQLNSWPQYISSLFGVLKKQHWSKAIILDRLLADVFIFLWNKHKPDFSVLFLNSGAHIQHHYMCNAMPYTGNAKNPNWYIKESQDPLLELLEVYDVILKDLMKLKNTRLMIATGLEQVPYESPSFYWRLKNHNDFLLKIGVKFSRVQPRMTRDFLIEFDNPKDIPNAINILSQIKSKDGEYIFKKIDNRGNDLFVTLTYNKNIDKDFDILLDNKQYKDFNNDVVFVAIKNGHHNQCGYYLDNNIETNILQQTIPLKDIFGYVMNHFDVKNENKY